MASVLRRILEKHGGRLRWSDWMQAALYDPESGYYTTAIRTVGHRGDFSTSATLSDGLGKAIATWIQREWRFHRRRLPLIEVGPGTGALHETILRHLPKVLRTALPSHLVETSPVLRRQQEITLASHHRRIHWHSLLSEALQHCGGEALIFSNELADAFPASLLQLDNGSWLEVWLAISPSGSITECLEPAAHGLSSSALALPWPEGQRIEILESWRQWLRTWTPSWSQGSLLTVDYGGSPESIYHRRPQGSARGYYRHAPVAAHDLYALTGRCDITTDVNFTDLRTWGEAAGLVTAELISQEEFVRRSSPDDPLCRDGGPASHFVCLTQRRPASP
jgi:SAM-dependent MidA family methyltransferase